VWLHNNALEAHKMTAELDVAFESGSLRLAGTLMLPDTNGTFPAALLIAGSGQTDRDENTKKIRLNALREIAEHLAEQGIATLRYDKRGVGASQGQFWEAGFFDNVSDAASALEYLKRHDHIQPDSVFVLGHSEGAAIAVRLAGTVAGVAGIILLGGEARSGEETLAWQAVQVTKGMRGFNGWLIRLLRIDVRKAQQKQFDKIKRSTKDWYRVQLIAKLNAKWLREFLAYDPAEDLSKIRLPVLAITGSKDIQVNPEDLDRMAELVKGDFEAHKLPNITHFLRTESGEPTISTYKQQVTRPVDAEILRIVSEWLHKRTAAI
jgi:pimeloyl-ACP methyl ester carboxylesterase